MKTRQRPHLAKTGSLNLISFTRSKNQRRGAITQVKTKPGNFAALYLIGAVNYVTRLNRESLFIRGMKLAQLMTASHRFHQQHSQSHESK